MTTSVRHLVMEINGNAAVVAFYDDERRVTQERSLLIPLHANGTINEPAFNEVLLGQATSFDSKVRVGLIQPMSLSDYQSARISQETRRKTTPDVE